MSDTTASAEQQISFISSTMEHVPYEHF